MHEDLLVPEFERVVAEKVRDLIAEIHLVLRSALAVLTALPQAGRPAAKSAGDLHAEETAIGGIGDARIHTVPAAGRGFQIVWTGL